MLVIKVHKIIGNCVVHEVGDKICIKGPEIDLQKTDKICIHALQTILHYAVALETGVDPVKLGLSKESGYAYLQCVDPGEPYTSGGTVIFKCKRVDAD